MAQINLDKSKTALLMADFATSGIGQNPIAQERHTLERAREVLDAARDAGIFVAFCISHFRPGYPEVSDRDTARSARRDSGEVLPTDPTTLIHPSVKPSEGEPVITKHRTSAFSGSAFEMILRAKNIETLILMGHSTSGVILSTVRAVSRRPRLPPGSGGGRVRRPGPGSPPAADGEGLSPAGHCGQLQGDGGGAGCIVGFGIFLP